MKQKNKKYLIVGSLMMAIMLFGGVALANTSKAQEGASSIWDTLTDEQKEQIKTMKEEKMAEKEEMQQAVEEGDYNKWKEIIDSRPKITDYINEDNFDRFSEMHKLMEEENFDEAKEIREELGLPDKGMMGHGMGKGMHKGFGKGMHKF